MADTDLTPVEGQALARLAEGRRVLLLGGALAGPAACLALTAALVEVVGPFDGPEQPEAVLAAVGALSERGEVRVRPGTAAEVAPSLAGGYGLVVLGETRTAALLLSDLAHALRLLAPGALLACRGYRAADAVTGAVNELVAGGATLVGVDDTLVVVRPKSRTVGRPLVALSSPRRGAFSASGEGFYLWPTLGRCDVVRNWTSGSILDHTFNRLWVSALNLRGRGVTHFAMIHDDILPAQGWLDVLLAELARTGADIVSAVVPIKSALGLTSTAIETGDPWRPRRLTVHEVHALPETFGDDDVGGELLLNTGLWVCDLRKPWIDDPAPLVFQTRNRIVRDDKGDWQAQVRSEDWEFSRAARGRGARLYATRKVALRHVGETDYRNDQPWGDWRTDELAPSREAQVV